MKKKNIETSKKGDEKMKINCKSNKVTDTDEMSEFITYPIVITEDGKISNDSSLDDFDNLSDIDDLNLKSSDVNEITKKKDNIKISKKNKQNTHKINDEKSVSKRPKLINKNNDVVEINTNKCIDYSISRKLSSCDNSESDSKKSSLINNHVDVVVTDSEKFIDNRIPRKVSTCDNSQSSENKRSLLFNSILKKISKNSDAEDDDEDNGHISKKNNNTVKNISSSNESNINIDKSNKTEHKKEIETKFNNASNVSCTRSNLNNIVMSPVESTNMLDDIGITVNDIPQGSVPFATPSGINGDKNKLPEALLRCAFIQNENSQTVIFWCEELTLWSFKCQNKIMQDIREGKNWATREIPFGSQTENQYSLYLHRNNVYIKGIHGTFGIRLFHYTLRNQFQTETNIKNTGRRIVKYVNHDCKATLLFDESRLFLYKKPCVWSNLIGKKGALDKLKRDTNEVLNDTYSSNPMFWENNTELIKKFFFVNKLQVDVAELLNAPLENIDPCIERTTELVNSVALRRKSVSENENGQIGSSEDLDPEDELISNNDENIIPSVLSVAVNDVDPSDETI